MHVAPSYWQKVAMLETTCDKNKRRKCQSSTAFEHQEENDHDCRRNV